MHPKVNSTPWSDDIPFPSEVTLYDMVYTPAQTRLMQQCQAAGGRAIGGIGMLVRQGAAAFKIWTGIEPPFDIMMDAVQQQLSERNTTE
jgi:shikimate dehydrogenase